MRIPHPSISDYTVIEYIEKSTSGLQYIDTNFIPKNSTRVVCSFQETARPSNYSEKNPFVFGARYVWNDRMFALGIDTNAINKTYFMYGSGNKNATANNVYNTRLEIDANKNAWAMSNGMRNTFSNTNFTCPLTLLLFNCNSHNSGIAGVVDGPINDSDAGLRMWSCQIYDNGTIVRNYVPRLLGSKPGFLDLCGSICPLTGTPFYVNAGTEEFLYA